MLTAFSRNEERVYHFGYRATSDGRIITPSSKEQKFYINSRGYYGFSVNIGGVSHKVVAHRLVAFQKFGQKIYDRELQVRHLDGNRLNNSDENIAIGTALENTMDKPAEVRAACAKKACEAAVKVCRIHDHKAIVEAHKAGMNYREIRAKFNISSFGTISFIINNSIESRN